MTEPSDDVGFFQKRFNEQEKPDPIRDALGDENGDYLTCAHARAMAEVGDFKAIQKKLNGIKETIQAEVCALEESSGSTFEELSHLKRIANAAPPEFDMVKYRMEICDAMQNILEVLGALASGTDPEFISGNEHVINDLERTRPKMMKRLRESKCLKKHEDVIKVGDKEFDAGLILKSRVKETIDEFNIAFEKSLILGSRAVHSASRSVIQFDEESGRIYVGSEEMGLTSQYPI